MKKVIKFLVIGICIIWVVLEVINFVQYSKHKEKIKEIENQYKNHQNLMRYKMDMSTYLLIHSREVDYRPLILKLFFRKPLGPV